MHSFPSQVPFLPPRQHALLAFLWSYSDRYGRLPSVREMAYGVGLRSKSSAHRLYLLVQEKGFVARSEPGGLMRLQARPRGRLRRAEP